MLKAGFLLNWGDFIEKAMYGSIKLISFHTNQAVILKNEISSE